MSIGFELPRSGEWVPLLQELAREARIWQGDTSYEIDAELDIALRKLQSEIGVEADGQPRGDTWIALAQRAEVTNQNEADIDWSEYPETLAVAKAENLDDYLRNVVGIDPDVFEDDEAPAGAGASAE